MSSAAMNRMRAMFFDMTGKPLNGSPAPVRKSLTGLFGTQSTEDECGDPLEIGNAACYLSPSKLLTMGITKETDTPDYRTVQRVNEVFDMADQLMLQRDRVEKLITEVGFDTVAAVLSTLTDQQVTKSLTGAFGWPVTRVTMADVVQLVQQQTVAKSYAGADALKQFMGPFVR